MQLLPVTTPHIRSGDDLARILVESCSLDDGDIVAVSSKVVAIAEDAVIDLSSLDITDEAQKWYKQLERNHDSPAFRQAVINEAVRMNGEVIGSCPQAMLTELRPDGMASGSILAVNAGLDRSNIEEGYAIGWPIDCKTSTTKLRKEIEQITGKRIGLILTDSCCKPRRLGVTAMALTVSGVDPLVNRIGSEDLHGNVMKMTREATADQLSVAANFLMGNADESTPAAIIRDHGLELSDYEGWVPGIEREEDLFCGMY